MITILALILSVITSLFMGRAEDTRVVVIPAKPDYSPDYVAGAFDHLYGEQELTEEQEWELYNQEAYYDYVSQFTALFNSYEVKHARNGALMIRRGNTGSFKFAKKG